MDSSPIHDTAATRTGEGPALTPVVEPRWWRLFNAMQRLPVWSERWRRRMLRRAGCQMAYNATVCEDVFVGGPNLRMDAGTFVNVGCLLDGNAPIHIGEGARLGPRVLILTGTHEYQPTVMRRLPGKGNINLPVVISRGCWIGIGTIIMPGVTVADGCVVGAGSVVLKSTEPNGLYAGNPARRVRDLPVR